MEERIVAHMNKDHHLALVDYAVVYGKEKLGSFDASSVQLKSVSTDSLVLSYETKNGETKTCEIDWAHAEEDDNIAVKTLSDLRPKLIAMGKYAAAKQGYSYKRVTQTPLPNSMAAIGCYVFLALVVSMLVKRDSVSNLLKSFVDPLPSPVERVLGWLERKIIPFSAAVYGIHLVEMIFIAIPRNRKYRTPLSTNLIWCGYCLVEGVMSDMRFKKLVQE